MTTKKNKTQRRKTRKGGMSANRFARERDNQVKRFFREAGEKLNEELIPIIEEVDAIIIGGNTIRAKEFVEKSKLDHRLLAKIYPEYVPTSQVNEQGLFEAMKVISRLPINKEMRDEQRTWDIFMKYLIKGNGRAIYGESEVRKAFNDEAVAFVLIHEDTIFNVNTMYSNKIYVYSRDTEPGQQLEAFGGVAAVTYYWYAE